MRGAELEHLGGPRRAHVVVDEPPLLGRHERHAGDGAGDGVEAQPLRRRSCCGACQLACRPWRAGRRGSGLAAPGASSIASSASPVPRCARAELEQRVAAGVDRRVALAAARRPPAARPAAPRGLAGVVEVVGLQLELARWLPAGPCRRRFALPGRRRRGGRRGGRRRRRRRSRPSGVARGLLLRRRVAVGVRLLAAPGCRCRCRRPSSSRNAEHDDQQQRGERGQQHAGAGPERRGRGRGAAAARAAGAAAAVRSRPRVAAWRASGGGDAACARRRRRERLVEPLDELLGGRPAVVGVLGHAAVDHVVDALGAAPGRAREARGGSSSIVGARLGGEVLGLERLLAGQQLEGDDGERVAVRGGGRRARPSPARARCRPPCRAPGRSG